MLHRLVLVAQLVDFKSEQIREVFGFLLLSATASTPTALLLLPHLHLHVAIQRFGTLQSLQCALFPGERVTANPAPQPLLRTLELNNRAFQFFLNLGEIRITR